MNNLKKKKINIKARHERLLLRLAEIIRESSLQIHTLDQHNSILRRKIRELSASLDEAEVVREREVNSLQKSASESINYLQSQVESQKASFQLKM